MSEWFPHVRSSLWPQQIEDLQSLERPLTRTESERAMATASCALSALSRLYQAVLATTDARVINAHPDDMADRALLQALLSAEQVLGVAGDPDDAVALTLDHVDWQSPLGRRR